MVFGLCVHTRVANEWRTRNTYTYTRTFDTRDLLFWTYVAVLSDHCPAFLPLTSTAALTRREPAATLAAWPSPITVVGRRQAYWTEQACSRRKC